AILDITGLPVVDTQVAGTLLHAAQAVRLLGAQIVLTGIQYEMRESTWRTMLVLPYHGCQDEQPDTRLRELQRRERQPDSARVRPRRATGQSESATQRRSGF